MRTSKTVGGVKHNYYYVEGKLMYEDCPSYKLYYTYDVNGTLSGIKKVLSSGTIENYAVLCNMFGDVIGIYNSSKSLVAKYTYDSWGKLLSITNANGADISSTDGVWTQNSIRYRGYVYDEETQLYYLQSRYYDPETCRFINADDYSVLTVSPTALSDKNLFAYCDCNPIVREDTQGDAWETVFDVASLAFSAVEVLSKPTDLTAWVGLIGDTVDLIPFVTGVGETIRTLRIADKITEGADTVIDTYHNLKKTTKNIGNEVHHIVEKRFSKQLGYNKTGSNMMSISLPKENHRIYTNAWRQMLPYGKKHDEQAILKSAAKIYSDAPQLFGSVLYTILKNKR